MRGLARWAASVIAAVILAVTTGASATAGTSWCVVDPIVYLDGRQLVLTTTFDATYISATTEVLYELEVPENVQTVSIVYDANPPVPERVVVRRTGAPYRPGQFFSVTVTVTVVSSATFPATTTASGANVRSEVTVTGTSNSPTTLKVKLVP